MSLDVLQKYMNLRDELRNEVFFEAPPEGYCLCGAEKILNHCLKCDEDKLVDEIMGMSDAGVLEWLDDNYREKDFSVDGNGITLIYCGEIDDAEVILDIAGIWHYVNRERNQVWVQIPSFELKK